MVTAKGVGASIVDCAALILLAGDCSTILDLTPSDLPWENALEQGVLGGLSSMNKEGKGFMTGFWSAEARAGDDYLNTLYKDDSPWVKYPVEIATNAIIQGSVGRFGGKGFSAGLFSGGTAKALSLSLGELENGNPEKTVAVHLPRANPHGLKIIA